MQVGPFYYPKTETRDRDRRAVEQMLRDDYATAEIVTWREHGATVWAFTADVTLRVTLGDMQRTFNPLSVPSRRPQPGRRKFALSPDGTPYVVRRRAVPMPRRERRSLLRAAR